MMRKCHLNTCPVGIATQDPILRKRFVGMPEHVVNFFFFIAEEVRVLMSKLGFKKFDELIGQIDVLDRKKAINHWKAKGLDFSKLFFDPNMGDGVPKFRCEKQQHPIENILDRRLIELSKNSLLNKEPVDIKLPIHNYNRSTGAMLSGEVVRTFGHSGLPDNTINICFKGTTGQAFGAWLSKGITLEVEGEANDYVGKGLSGGKIVVYPPKVARKIIPDKSIIAGNTILYGAVEGECFLRGIVGERFAVRNSGAIAVVEGVGDHGCEYMTGGVVVVLGKTGLNFAAGMSGGIAYVLDEDGTFKSRCNMAMVELEPVPEEDDLLESEHHHGGDFEHHGRVDISSDMTRYDEERLKNLISSHLKFTKSDVAKKILDNWDVFRPKFLKVMPTEYRRALEEIKAEKLNKIVAAE